MKLPVLNKTKTEVSKRDLPVQFSEEIREDIIKRAVVKIEANSRQPYGSDPWAGMRASAELSRRRRAYRGSYGIGISRVPRKILSRRGTRMNWVGAVAPGTVGGRRAHPPKAEKNWTQKLNKKENRKAIRSALSACIVKEIVQRRGHYVPENYPFIISSDFEAIDKTKDALESLKKLGFGEELERAKQKKVRAGKGTMRGRKYKKRKGPLVVVSGDCKLLQAAKNIPGIDVEMVDRINAKLLAPGAKPGRATLFTEGAIERLEKEALFLGIIKKTRALPKAKKEEKKAPAKKKKIQVEIDKERKAE